MRIESVSATRPAIGPLDVDAKETKSIDASKEIRSAESSMRRDMLKEQVSISEQQLIEAIENANKALRGADKRFEFSIHEGTKEIMVKVINDETGEIIREIPPEKILDMVAKMWELAGILVDRKI